MINVKPNINDMWNDLSNDAKNVIEWVEHPYSGRKMTVEIERGTYFIPDHKYSTKIFITNNIYEEIKNYVNRDDSLEINEDLDKLSFYSGKRKLKLS